MKHRTACLMAIAFLAFLPLPNIVLGQNMNLSGSLNVNDTQVISTTNLLLSLVVSLAESIIPLVVGAAVGHKSIAYWHEKKDRIATKNNMIEDYARSFKIHGPMLDNFVQKVFRSYVIFGEAGGVQAVPLNEYSASEDKVKGFLKFPTDPNELPSRKFCEEYGELGDKIGEVSHSRECLYLDLKYFGREGLEMVEKLQNIKNLLRRSEIVLDKFVKSTDREEFMGCYETYQSLSGRIKTEMGKIESDMVRVSSANSSKII